MRILVTGGSGFVGSHVVDALLAAGYEPVVLDLAAPPAHLAGRVPWTRADVGDGPAVERALRGVDACCHQAAKVGLGAGPHDFPAYARANDLGTATLLAAMARVGIGSLVLASSMVVYGEGDYACAEHGPVSGPVRRAVDLDRGRFEPVCPHCGAPLVPGLVEEDAALDPRNAYAASKVAQEHYAAAWARDTGGTAVALRYHNVYGPRLPVGTPYAGVAALFRAALLRGAEPQVFEDGGQRRDFVHVRDVAAANLAALAALAPGSRSGAVPAGRLRPYNVASGMPRTVGDLARALSLAMDGPEPVVTGEYRAGDVRHITASSARIRRELGWEPATGFDRGIAELVRDVTVP